MPRFVVLEHNWNGVHWDFMLEAGEVLRTWAIDEPIVSGRDLPARSPGRPSQDLPGIRGRSGATAGRCRRVDPGDSGCSNGRRSGAGRA